MKKFYLIGGLWAALFSANAQQVATFDDVELESGSWYNGSDGAGGFTSGGFWFPNEYNFEWASWRGFSVSNMKDTITAGSQNQFSAITACGAAGSENYAVVYCPAILQLQFEPAVEVTGFDVTNSTYAYLTMCNGDDFGAKIFGGTDGSDPDYFKIMISGVDSVGNPADTLEFFLADFRFEDTARDYILKTWQWLDLSSLGKLRGLHLSMESTDNGDWGMNTPAYFCMDNFTSGKFTSTTIQTACKDGKVNFFPNPVKDILNVDVPENTDEVVIMESTGKLIFSQATRGKERLVLDALSQMPAGIYFLRIRTEEGVRSEKIVKI